MATVTTAATIHPYFDLKSRAALNMIGPCLSVGAHK
jgi:hypothetical protein